MPQFPHLEDGENNVTYLISWKDTVQFTGSINVCLKVLLGAVVTGCDSASYA